jgi:hypothetical protein
MVKRCMLCPYTFANRNRLSKLRVSAAPYLCYGQVGCHRSAAGHAGNLCPECVRDGCHSRNLSQKGPLCSRPDLQQGLSVRSQLHALLRQ